MSRTWAAAVLAACLALALLTVQQARAQEPGPPEPSPDPLPPEPSPSAPSASPDTQSMQRAAPLGELMAVAVPSPTLEESPSPVPVLPADAAWGQGTPSTAYLPLQGPQGSQGPHGSLPYGAPSFGGLAGTPAADPAVWPGPAGPAGAGPLAGAVPSPSPPLPDPEPSNSSSPVSYCAAAPPGIEFGAFPAACAGSSSGARCVAECSSAPGARPATVACLQDGTWGPVQGSCHPPGICSSPPPLVPGVVGPAFALECAPRTTLDPPCPALPSACPPFYHPTFTVACKFAPQLGPGGNGSLTPQWVVQPGACLPTSKAFVVSEADKTNPAAPQPPSLTICTVVPGNSSSPRGSGGPSFTGCVETRVGAPGSSINGVHVNGTRLWLTRRQGGASLVQVCDLTAWHTIAECSTFNVTSWLPFGITSISVNPDGVAFVTGAPTDPAQPASALSSALLVCRGARDMSGCGMVLLNDSAAWHRGLAVTHHEAWDPSHNNGTRYAFDVLYTSSDRDGITQCIYDAATRTLGDCLVIGRDLSAPRGLAAGHGVLLASYGSSSQVDEHGKAVHVRLCTTRWRPTVDRSFWTPELRASSVADCSKLELSSDFAAGEVGLAIDGNGRIFVPHRVDPLLGAGKVSVCSLGSGGGRPARARGCAVQSGTAGAGNSTDLFRAAVNVFVTGAPFAA